MPYYQCVGGPIDGMVLLIEKDKEPEEIECRIREGCHLFALYALTEQGYYWHLQTFSEPQEVPYFVDLEPINQVVGSGRMKCKIPVWQMVEDLTGGF